MSGAREVGGVKSTSGRKAKRHMDGLSVSRKEARREKLAYADYLTRKKIARLLIGKPQFGKNPRHRRKRASPGAWLERFLAGVVETGSLRVAARLAGVSYVTARRYKSRDLYLRLELAIGEWCVRQVDQVARGVKRRFEITPRIARAMAAFEKSKREQA